MGEAPAAAAGERGEAPPDAVAGERPDAAAPPHATSIAVWGVPSPVVVGSRFAATVGVKCPAACSLAGRPVVVRDAAGAEVGRGRLDSQPAPGTRALYAASVALAAPAEAGVHAWTATFPAAGSGAPPAAESGSAEGGAEEATPETAAPPEAPHAEARAAFSFRAAAPPEHRVTVTVHDQATEAPLAAVEVHVGPYRAATDGDGRTRVDVPTGDYDLYVRKAGYAPHTGRVAVTGDVALQVAAAPAPDIDADDEQVWM